MVKMNLNTMGSIDANKELEMDIEIKEECVTDRDNANELPEPIEFEETVKVEEELVIESPVAPVKGCLFSCQHCSRVFSRKSDLGRHMKSVHNDSFVHHKKVSRSNGEQPKITKARKTNENKTKRKKIIIKLSSSEPHIAEETLEKVPPKTHPNSTEDKPLSELSSFQATVNEDKPSRRKHPCPMCNAFFGNRDLLKIHINDFHFKAQNLIACLQCSYKCKTEFQLRCHVNDNHLDLKWQCKVCLKRFSLQKDLFSHSSCRLGEFQHRCNLCNFRTTNKADLQTHTKLQHLKEYLEQNKPKPKDYDIEFAKFIKRKSIKAQKKLAEASTLIIIDS